MTPKIKKQGVEKKSYPIIKASFERLGAWYHKIADQGYIPGVMNRFTPTKPFDMEALFQGVNYYIEMKGAREIRGLSIRDVRKSQIEAFKKIIPNKRREDYVLIGYYFYTPRELKKLLFIDYNKLANQGLIPKKEVLLFLERKGDIHGENYIDPEDGKKKRRHFFPLEKIDDYII